MKRKHFLTVFFSLIIFCSSFGQNSKAPKPASVSIDTLALAIQLDSLFSTFNQKNSPGFAITIVKDDKVVCQKNYGMASIELGVPFTHSTVIRLPYSEGREFIAIAAAMMEQQGLLSLTDRVISYFPDLPQWSKDVTLQDLLNHSSGFCDEWATLVLTQAEMSNRLDLSQFLDFLYRQPEPQIEPGRGYMYSNSDFGLLRLILEKACGKNLSVYMTEKIFAPLGMTQTKLGRNKEEVVLNHAFSYAEEENGRYTVWMRDKTSPGGNYWVLTCANDLEKWSAAHMDSKSFICKAAQRLKEKARPIPVLKDGTNYVFGHKIRQLDSTEVISHQGVSGYSYLTRAPAAGLSIICVGNNLYPYADKTDALLRVLLKSKNTVTENKKFSSKPVTISPVEMRQYEGTYRWMNQAGFQSSVERKQYSELKVIGDSLWLIYSSVESFPLIYVGSNMFKDPDYPIWLVMHKSHPDSALRVTIHRQTASNDMLEWQKVTVNKKVYSKAELQNFTGTYYSQHLDFYWRIVLNDKGQLVLKRPTVADKIIEPGYDLEFKLPIQFHFNDESWAWIKFYFSENGMVEYLDVHHSRLMHHRFDKKK